MGSNGITQRHRNHENFNNDADQHEIAVCMGPRDKPEDGGVI